MITIRFRGEDKFFRTLTAIEHQVEDGAAEGAKEAAEAIATFIKSHWSPNSPSNKGDPPAIDTGNLDSSILVAPSTRSLRSGRFAKKGTVWEVTANTQDGQVEHKTKYNYTQALEDPSHTDRPFFAAAVETVAQDYPQYIKDGINIKGGAWRH